MAAPDAVLRGRGRLLGSGGPPPDAAEFVFDSDAFTFRLGADTRVVAYRDVDTVAVQQATALLVLGDGPGAERFVLDQFGQFQGRLVRELRDRRLRQRLADAFAQVPDDPIALLEYESGTEHGVGQYVEHPWGAVLAPIDERVPAWWIRRGAIREVGTATEQGTVEVHLEPHEDAAGGRDATLVRFLGLGSAARTFGDRITALRNAAAADAGHLVGLLVPDAPYGARQLGARTLVDGRPADPAALGDAWSILESGVLTEPTFAESYAALRQRAGGESAPRWIAMAPSSPGADQPKTWFFVGLPGNLVALELVSEGAHATYCFRVVPRATFAGSTTADAWDGAVRELSDALVDARFLREPIALPDDQLRLPAYLRYRLALAALPSLAAARRRFVARLVHRDAAGWAAALDDLMAWHGAQRDDAAVWPGRAAQEAQVTAAQGGSPTPDNGPADIRAPAGGDASPADSPAPDAPSTSTGHGGA